jgi:putative hemolysin
MPDKKGYHKILAHILIVGVILSACSAAPSPTAVAPTSEGSTTNLANPAAVYCQQIGGQVKLRIEADGSQTGRCIFKDNSECDEWALYRGECGPGGIVPPTPIPQISSSRAINTATDECNQRQSQQIGPLDSSHAEVTNLQNAQKLLGVDLTANGMRGLNTQVWSVTLIGTWEITGRDLTLTQEAGGKPIEPTPTGPHPTATPTLLHLCRVTIDANTGEFFGLSRRTTP